MKFYSPRSWKTILFPELLVIIITFIFALALNQNPLFSFILFLVFSINIILLVVRILKYKTIYDILLLLGFLGQYIFCLLYVEQSLNLTYISDMYSFIINNILLDWLNLRSFDFLIVIVAVQLLTYYLLKFGEIIYKIYSSSRVIIPNRSRENLR
jgi:hypothetical protein